MLLFAKGKEQCDFRCRRKQVAGLIGGQATKPDSLKEGVAGPVSSAFYGFIQGIYKSNLQASVHALKLGQNLTEDLVSLQDREH